MILSSNIFTVTLAGSGIIYLRCIFQEVNCSSAVDKVRFGFGNGFGYTSLFFLFLFKNVNGRFIPVTEEIHGKVLRVFLSSTLCSHNILQLMFTLESEKFNNK